MNHPSVGFADSQRLKNYFQKEGTLVHLFVTKESVDNDWNTFQEFVFHEIALPVIDQKIMARGSFTVVFSDGGMSILDHRQFTSRRKRMPIM